jgi:hypothetical protein
MKSMIVVSKWLDDSPAIVGGYRIGLDGFILSMSQGGSETSSSCGGSGTVFRQ